MTKAIAKQESPKIKPFVIKSVFEVNCKGFRKSAIQKFNLRTETLIKKPFQ